MLPGCIQLHYCDLFELATLFAGKRTQHRTVRLNLYKEQPTPYAPAICAKNVFRQRMTSMDLGNTVLAHLVEGVKVKPFINLNPCHINRTTA